MHIRPRRSVLYMPGANERALEKAKTLPADSLILDLEDSVAPEAKAIQTKPSKTLIVMFIPPPRRFSISDGNGTLVT